MANYGGFLLINGTAIRDPSEMQIDRNDVSKADAGRDESGKMQKHRIATKYKLTLKWNGLRPEQATPVLTATDDEYFNCTFPDPFNGGKPKTIEAYRGDTKAPVYWWRDKNQKIFQNVAYDIIER